MKSVNQQSPQATTTDLPPPPSSDGSINDNETLSPEKQLLKLKRFLKTIYQFSKDLSTTQRDKVKELILDVINEQITEQQFYSELQGSTKFPLRPYVVPFLQSSLPLLRNEYGAASKENVEAALFDELLLQESTVTHCNSLISSNNNNNNNNSHNHNNIHAINSEHRSKEILPRKRRSVLSSHESPVSPKRLMSQSPYPNLTSVSSPREQNVARFGNFLSAGGMVNGNLSPGGANGTTNILARPDLISNGVRTVDFWSSQNEEWRNVETLFSTMVATMERLRYAMLLFQQRAKLAQLWNEKFQLQQQRQQDSNLKIEEVKRKADAAVQEVKLAALTELQKAVLTAEQKALQMIAAERAQMEKLLRDTQHQENSMDNCWNCGRKAGQTCSGCGLARYCGVFCQHKDWSNHRNTCGANSSSSSSSSSSALGDNKPLKIKTEPSSSSLSLSKERPSPKSV